MRIGEKRELHAAPELLVLTISGQLRTEEFRTRLGALTNQMRPGASYALLFDVLQMEGYEPAVRDGYLRWHRLHGAQVRRVAVVTNRAMWRLVVATLGLASGGTTRAFERVDEARDWLRTG